MIIHYSEETNEIVMLSPTVADAENNLDLLMEIHKDSTIKSFSDDSVTFDDFHTGGVSIEVKVTDGVPALVRKELEPEVPPGV